MTPRSSSLNHLDRVLSAYPRRRQPDHVEGADQVDPDGALERLQLNGPVAAHYPARGADPGAIDKDASGPMQRRALPPSPSSRLKRRPIHAADARSRRRQIAAAWAFAAVSLISSNDTLQAARSPVTVRPWPLPVPSHRRSRSPSVRSHPCASVPFRRLTPAVLGRTNTAPGQPKKHRPGKLKP